ncbi:MAG: hypothetical protein IPL11_20195 [Candidatus Accumulibacter sp.]|nr:hypothetical protein [Accumulibacter sp.]
MALGSGSRWRLSRIDTLSCAPPVRAFCCRCAGRSRLALDADGAFDECRHVEDQGHFAGAEDGGPADAAQVV